MANLNKMPAKAHAARYGALQVDGHTYGQLAQVGAPQGLG